jgi:hypothetical protein
MLFEAKKHAGISNHSTAVMWMHLLNKARHTAQLASSKHATYGLQCWLT